jgi:hypothetical protein
MNFRPIAACVIVATTCASPLALAAPGWQTFVTKYKSASTVVNLQAEDGAFQYSMSAQNYDDMDGVQQGIVSVGKSGFDPVTGQFFIGGVFCQGPAYANTVTVNRSTGQSSVNVMLDPAGPGCFGFNTMAVTIAISGVPTGGFSRSDTGTSTFKYGGGVVDKASFQSDGFDEAFSGSIGYYTGAFTGNAEAARVTNRTRVK